MNNYLLVIEIPGLPRTANGSHGHWATRASHAKRWHKLVALAVGRNGPGEPLTKAKLTLTRCSTAAPDSDNLAGSFKHPVDGLVRAGVLIDDKFSVIGMPTYLWERAGRNKGKIRIKIESSEFNNNQTKEIT